MPVMTGLSGNEMWCLSKKGLAAGDLIIGNSVVSMGLFGSLGSGVRTLLGGEVTQVSEMVREGRNLAYARLVDEAQKRNGVGVTGVSSELLLMGSNAEFLSVGNALHTQDAGVEPLQFTSSADGQELFCQIDAGFRPIRFVFGNVAYSVGVGRGLMGVLRSMRRGEVKEFSDVFNHTRHRALERITQEARDAGANAVVGIKTSIIPFRGMHEMVMVGTASHHPSLDARGAAPPVTCDLTCQEMWNLVKLGYMPLQLVLGVSVYSFGLVGRVKNWFRSLVRGELTDYTRLVYEARENAIARIASEAQAVGADDVAGLKTYVYDLGGGLLEFLVIGTAVKRVPGLSTTSEQLPYQAVITDRDTFVNTAETQTSASLNQAAKGASNAGEARGTLGSVLRILFDLLK